MGHATKIERKEGRKKDRKKERKDERDRNFNTKLFSHPN